MPCHHSYLTVKGCGTNGEDQQRQEPLWYSTLMPAMHAAQQSTVDLIFAILTELQACDNMFNASESRYESDMQ